MAIIEGEGQPVTASTPQGPLTKVVDSGGGGGGGGGGVGGTSVQAAYIPQPFSAPSTPAAYVAAVLGASGGSQQAFRAFGGITPGLGGFGGYGALGGFGGLGGAKLFGAGTLLGRIARQRRRLGLYLAMGIGGREIPPELMWQLGLTRGWRA